MPIGIGTSRWQRRNGDGEAFEVVQGQGLQGLLTMPENVEPITDPVRPFVSERIREDGWGAIHAINWAFDRDVVEKFRACVMLVRLCSDEKARADRLHPYLHRMYGAQGCVGQDLLLVTQKALGISDERARYLIDQMDQEYRAAQGLLGTGGE